jgi:hypothetical protein
LMSWRSVLFVGETGISGEIRRSVTSYWQTLSYDFVYSTHRHEQDSNSQL